MLSTMMVVVSLTITLLCLYTLFVEPSRDIRERLWLKLVLGGFAALGAVVLVPSVRTLLDPPVLFEVTTDGIVIRREGGAPLAAPFFIPWDRVESLAYLVQKGVDDQGDVATLRTIAVRVRTDERWPPRDHVEKSFEASKQLVHLDAFTGAPHGRDLLRRIEAIRASRAS